MSSYVRPIDAILPRAARSFGGKARTLAALARAGFPVPAGYVVSCEAAEAVFADVLPPRLQPAVLFAEAAPLDADLAQARELVLRAPLPRSLQLELRHALLQLRAAGAPSAAVRSSSVVEVQHVASAAGLHTAILNVTSEESLYDAVRACWANVFSPRVLDYMHALGAKDAGAVGVVIQAMVPADVAGTLFTVNPLTQDENELVVHAAYGLGVAAAEARVSPDTYYIDKHSGFLRDRVIGVKLVRVDAPVGGGLREHAVSPELARKEALDEHTRARLVDLALRVERHFGDPREIEWALFGDSLYVLQSKPIAVPDAWSEPKRRQRSAKASQRRSERSIVWSNLNVGEALPGVATPLTWSVLSGFSDLGFRKAFGALGCSVPKNASFVGNFRGRIYLNLSSLSQVAAQVPGLRPSTVLPLGGGAEIARLERELPKTGSIGFLSRLPATVTRFLRENVGLRAKLESFEPAFFDECSRIRGLDLRVLPSPSLDETLSDAQRLLDDTGALMLTAYGRLLAALVPLSAALRVAVGDDAPRLQLELMSALSDVESANPGRELQRIAAVAAGDDAAKQLIMEQRRGLLVQMLPMGPTRAALLEFLARHGHRGIREAELAQPRWREDPSLIFDMLRLHLRRAALGESEGGLSGGQASRARGQDTLQSLALPARAAIEGLLTVVRHAMRMRERLRGHVVNVLDLLRLLALDVSRRMAVREPGIGDDAAFFLTLSEMHGFLRGELRVVRPLVEMRRAGFERDRSLPDPPSTFVDYPPPVTPRAAHATTLEGLPASAGRVQGKARVLTSESQIPLFEPGEILVVPAADIGWSPLFLAARGLATDLGGPLSHACVVAREYGIPAVVNLRVATRTVRTGDEILLDGDAGRLQVLTHRHG